MTKFIEEFNKRTDNKFSMLKLNSATYLKDKRELSVRFIISAFEIANLTNSMQAEIKKVVENIFEGVKVDIQYIRTYADQNVVKNKILEYFNRYNQIIFRRINDENTKIFVSDADISIEFNLETPLFYMFTTGNTVVELTDYLDSSFNQEINISVKETVVNLQDAIADQDLELNTVTFSNTSLRLIDVKTGDKIYARGKIGGINQLPNYIMDVKSPAENIILCGKVSNVSKKMYKNKKYNANNPKFGPEELPLIRFMLDDTTSKLECVCFPQMKDVEIIENMRDGQTVVCTGNLSISSYNNALSYAVNAIFDSEIDFDSIKNNNNKPVPERYKTIFPEPYTQLTQSSFFESNKISDYFKGKTFVVFDLEATDTFPEKAEIIEIAACKIKDGKPVETFQTLVNPNMEIPAKITEITSIDNGMVENSPNFIDVLPDFYKFTRNCILVGHNITEYDYPLVAKYATKEGYNFDNDLVDTLVLSRKLLTEVKSKRLEDLSKTFGISHENAHRAMSDVFATYDLLKILAKRM